MYNLNRATMGKGGALNGCGACMKITLIAMNVMGLVVSVVFLGTVIWIWSTRLSSSTLLSNNLFLVIMSSMVTMGGMMLLLSLLGLCAASKERKWKLMAYSILVLIILIGFVLAAILEFVYRSNIEKTLDSTMYGTLSKYGKSHEYTQSWDDTHTYLQCCGVQSYRDWKGKVPRSCCKENLDCVSSPGPATTYTEGCLNKTVNFLRKDSTNVGIASMVVSLFLLLAILLACGLYSNIGKTKRSAAPKRTSLQNAQARRNSQQNTTTAKN